MKAKLEIVPRPEEHVRHHAGAVNAALRRDRYKGELESDLGLVPSSRPVRQRASSTVDWGTVTVTFVLALVTFAAVFTFLLWRDGRLPRLWPASHFKWEPKPPSKEWIQSGKHIQAREAAGQRGEPEPDISVTILPGPAPAVPPESSDDSVAANAAD